MDDDRVAGIWDGNRDTRYQTAARADLGCEEICGVQFAVGRGECRVKYERQIESFYGSAKLRTGCAVPADDPIEKVQAAQQTFGWSDIAEAQVVEAGRLNRRYFVRERQQRYQRGRDPDFRLFAFGGEMFECRKRENAVADCAGTDDQLPHRGGDAVKCKLAPAGLFRAGIILL